MTSYNFCINLSIVHTTLPFLPYIRYLYIYVYPIFLLYLGPICLYVCLSSCMSVHLIPYTIIIVAYRFPIISSFFPFLCIPPYIHHYRSHRDQDMRKISRDSYQGPDVSRNWTPESRPMTTIDGVSLKRGNP